MRRTQDLMSFSAIEVGNFLACQHRTGLELRVAAGELERPPQNDIQRRLLEKRGLEHEARVLERFRADGLSIAEIPIGVGEPALRKSAEETLAAMNAAVDIIYQGA